MNEKFYKKQNKKTLAEFLELPSSWRAWVVLRLVTIAQRLTVMHLRTVMKFHLDCGSS